jgi:hypothetical protein
MSFGHNKTTKKQKSWDVKEPAVLADSNPVQRVDLKVDEFDRLLSQKGANVCCYRTTYCPNVKSVDGAEHEIDCPLCNGSGFIDLNPIQTKAFIQNQDLERIMDSAAGQFDGNSVAMTFPIGIELQYFTLIELVDYTQIYYQRVLRKPGTLIDVLKYKACRVNVIVDKNNVQYYQGQDFKLDPNGNIQWLDRKPADNLIYSIHYECHSQFRATRAMHVNRFTQYKPPGEAGVEHIKLPEQWICTKEFLLRRRDINTNADLNEGPFGPHTNTTGNNT